MPIQPKFSLSQNNENIRVKIYVPHIRVTNIELIAENNNFTFYCQPYLLKLTFPGDIDGDNEKCRAVYNVDEEDGVVLANLPKKIVFLPCFAIFPNPKASPLLLLSL
jgi:protein SHQ1